MFRKNAVADFWSHKGMEYFQVSDYTESEA